MAVCAPPRSPARGRSSLACWKTTLSVVLRRDGPPGPRRNCILLLGQGRCGCNRFPGFLGIGKWYFRTNLRNVRIAWVCEDVWTDQIEARSHVQKNRRSTPAAASGLTAPAPRDAPFSLPNFALKRMNCVLCILPSLAYTLSALCFPRKSRYARSPVQGYQSQHERKTPRSAAGPLH